MTSALVPGLAPPEPGPIAPARRVLVRLPAAWPFTALFALFPIWWALGLGSLIFNVMAIPMALHLWRRRPLRFPPGFGIWALFLVWVLVGFLMLAVNPIGTVPGSAAGRSIAYTHRFVSYLALTLLLLYVGNLSERELPTKRIIALMGWMFGVTVTGGLASLVAPTFEFTSLVELVLPNSIASNGYVQTLVHPAFSQVQNVIGYDAPRPKAPFEYTNFWGNNLSLTALWFVCLGALGMLSRRRWLRWGIVGTGMAIAVIPAIWSLNRGLWIGAGLSIAYLALRLALKRQFKLIGVLAGVICLGAAMVPVTPLGDVITSRLNNPKSNEIRSNLTEQTFALVNRSPILGFGSTRSALGSPESLAVGKSADCPQCGNFPIGSTGQLWLLLVSTGYPGAALYFLFLIQAIWRYRRDDSPIGIAASLSLFLALFYSLFYNALPSPLALYLIAIGLLWRNDMQRERQTAFGVPLEGSTPPGGTARAADPVPRLENA